LDRNWLKGKIGDAMHVVLCAAGQNLRLILRAMEAFLAHGFPMLSCHHSHPAGFQAVYRPWLPLRAIESRLGRRLAGLYALNREVHAAL
jgi:hypothetical protein